jgi:hypothetical protein
VKEKWEKIDPESFHYLEKFEGKTGQVFDITTTSGGFHNYHVNFGNEIGVFYTDEIEHVAD